MPTWLMVLIAVAMAVMVWRVGMASVRSFSRPGFDHDVPDVPEDVDDLEVFLVCGECGTELKVARLGALQIPRHCGEKMRLERHPAGP
jgi:hypothetical protein